MKKGICLFAIACFLFTNLKAQDDAAWMGQGSTVINLGYGIGSIWKSSFKLLAGFTGSKVSATGPVVGGFEYGVSERIGIGLQLGYGNVKNVSTDPGANSNGGDLITTEKLSSFQVLARGNYHLGHSASFDPYLGLGLGYGNFKYEVTDNDSQQEPQTFFAVPSSLLISGVLGAKYYFATNIGVYAEVGYVTGSYLQVGLAIKF